MSVFRPGSTSPSAILFDAWESFTQRSSKADESIRSIRPEVAAAVNECIDAAGHEWEPYWQRRLLSVSPLTTSQLSILFDKGGFFFCRQQSLAGDSWIYTTLVISLRWGRH